MDPTFSSPFRKTRKKEKEGEKRGKRGGRENFKVPDNAAREGG